MNALTPIATPVARIDPVIWGPESPAKTRRFDLLLDCDDADREFHETPRLPSELAEVNRQAAHVASMARQEVSWVGGDRMNRADSIMEDTLDGEVDVPTYRFIRALVALELDRTKEAA